MMKKRILSLALALTLCLGLSVPAFASEPPYNSSELFETFEIHGDHPKYPDAEYINASLFIDDLDDTSPYYPFSRHGYNPLENGATITVTNKNAGKYGAYISSIRVGVYHPIEYGEFVEFYADEYNILVQPTDKLYTMDNHLVLADDGRFFNSALSPEFYGGNKQLRDGESVTFELKDIPMYDDDSPYTWEDALYEITVNLYLPEYDWSYWWWWYFKYDEEGASANAANRIGSFTDVHKDDWYGTFVDWAVTNNITAGTSATTFSPDQTCTVAQILTLLYSANGKPDVSGANPFSDVSATDWYYAPALWAYQQGMVDGGALHPNDPCTRSMVVTYLWKQANSPQSGSSSFTDVAASAPYAQAVSWAVQRGITAGTSDTTFSPDQTCTRAQIVTFLYNALAQ